ncbi:hypothetical protein [Actinophytocola sp.]|uniref:hypothetical protein n=1 Tax=Actinophytocola sp. TaxID=1872138 RepID=UPI003D6B4F78
MTAAEPSRMRPYVQDTFPTTIMTYSGFDAEQTVPDMFTWLDEEERWLIARSPQAEVLGD